MLRLAIRYKTGVTLIEAVVDRLTALWGGAVAVHEVLVDHQERAVIRSVDPAGRPVVVKADRDVARSQREARALFAVAAADVPVPIVHERLDGPPAILVLDHVEGRPLGSTSPDEHWRAVGRQLRRLHDEAAPDGLPMFGGGDLDAAWWPQLRRLADWAADWCRRRRMLDPDVLAYLDALMTTAFARDDEPVGHLVHGDCGPYHWLLRDGAVAAVIDFGDCGRGDPALDLAALVLWDPDRLPAVLDGYGAGAAMQSHLAAVLLPYTVIRHLLAIPWLVDHGIDPAPTVAELHRIGRRKVPDPPA
jgi:aminoglycoside phosphotransferase (APT) family kinase protein